MAEQTQDSPPQVVAEAEQEDEVGAPVVVQTETLLPVTVVRHIMGYATQPPVLWVNVLSILSFQLIRLWRFLPTRDGSRLAAVNRWHYHLMALGYTAAWDVEHPMYTTFWR